MARYLPLFILMTVSLLLPSLSYAAGGEVKMLDLTTHWVGYAAIALFVLAYTLVVLEEKIHMRKSKPVMVAAGLIWAMIAIVYASQQDSSYNHTAEVMIRQNILEYAELFLLLFA
jgi:hypothetical protein